jgi:Leucine-rich repeat (LRR) protein
MGGSNSKSSAAGSRVPDSALSEAQKTGSLDLVGLKLTDRLPESVCVTSVGNVREILAGFNFFTRLPPNLAVFKNLETLRLDGNLIVNLDDITPILGSMSALTELGLNGNSLESLPNDFPVAVSRLEKLDLANNRIRRLPATIGHMVHLEELNMMGNPLSAIPDSFGQLCMLEALDSSCCELTQLPDDFTKLTRLMELNLSMNALEVLPSTMGNLTRLCVLNISDNRLTDLPLSMGFCQCLEVVQCSRNPFKDEKLVEMQKLPSARVVLLFETRMQDFFASQGIVSY